MITEDMLRAAAARSCENHVEYLIQNCNSENQHVFSAEFEEKIRRLAMNIENKEND